MVRLTSRPRSIPVLAIRSMSSGYWRADIPLVPSTSSSFAMMVATGSSVARAASRPAWTWRPCLRRQRTELAATSALPRASTDTWAPPPVMSRTAPTAARPLSGSAVTAAAAPMAAAISSAPLSMSTATTRAPTAEPTITMHSPSPPQPCTASHSPEESRARSIRAR